MIEPKASIKILEESAIGGCANEVPSTSRNKVTSILQLSTGGVTKMYRVGRCGGILSVGTTPGMQHDLQSMMRVMAVGSRGQGEWPGASARGC